MNLNGEKMMENRTLRLTSAPEWGEDEEETYDCFANSMQSILKAIVKLVECNLYW